MNHPASLRRRRSRCRVVQRLAFAGHSSPDPGTNVDLMADYLSLFPGRNAAARFHERAARGVRQRMRQDGTADYYTFSLNSTVPGLNQFVRGFRQACERATVRLFPNFSKSHPERHDPQSSIAVIVLPAVSASGRLHFHGWVRIPRTAPQTPGRLWIHEQGHLRVVDAPEAIVTFVDALVAAPDAPFCPGQRYYTSLWVANRDGRAASTGTEGFGLKYLMKTGDYEVRQWADVEFVPTHVLGPVVEEGQARRHERARELRERRRAGHRLLDSGKAA